MNNIDKTAEIYYNNISFIIRIHIYNNNFVNLPHKHSCLLQLMGLHETNYFIKNNV